MKHGGKLREKGHIHYARASGHEILDHALRLCQAFLVTNLTGMSTSYSRIPAATLYFMWCSVRCVKLHLGFWIAYQYTAVSRRPSRNFTLYHLLGRFIHDNFEFGDSVSPMKANPQVNPPRNFDLEFLRRAGLVRMFRDDPRFYTVGESPSLMISRRHVGGEQELPEDKKETKKRLKKMEKKLTEEQIAHEKVTRELRETRAAQAQGQKDLKADLERLMLIVGQLAQLQPQPAPAPSIAPAQASETAPASTPASEPAPEFVVEPEGAAPATPPPAASARTPRKRQGR